MHRNFVVFRNVASLKKKQRKKTRKSVSGLKRQVRYSRGNQSNFLCQNGENWPIWRCRTESDEWICLIQPFPSSTPGITDKRTALCVWFSIHFLPTVLPAEQRDERHSMKNVTLPSPVSLAQETEWSAQEQRVLLTKTESLEMSSVTGLTSNLLECTPSVMNSSKWTQMRIQICRWGKRHGKV